MPWAFFLLTTSCRLKNFQVGLVTITFLTISPAAAPFYVFSSAKELFGSLVWAPTLAGRAGGAGFA